MSLKAADIQTLENSEPSFLMGHFGIAPKMTPRWDNPLITEGFAETPQKEKLRIKAIHFPGVIDAKGRHQPDRAELANFYTLKQELDLAAGIIHPGVARMVRYAQKDNILYVCYKTVLGFTLNEAIPAKGHNLELALLMFIELAKNLAAVHETGLICRNIMPGNFLSQDLATQLESLKKLAFRNIGLGISEKIGGQKADIWNNAGYRAPEQLMSDVPVDQRADLYALGAVFYHILAGHPPFNSGDIDELMRQQISAEPAPLQRMDVPALLKKIIFKLLAKRPEERYQTAAGLLTDLEKFARDIEQADFELDAALFNPQLNFHARLIGRENDLNKLQLAWADTLNGSGRIVCLGGEAGLGKTRLAAELRLLINENILYGRYLENSGHRLYSGLNEALEAYLQYFSRYAPEKQTQIKTRLAKELDLHNPNSRPLLLAFNPLFKTLLADEAEQAVLPQNMEYLYVVLANFWLCLARAERGLLLFLDDIKWMDEASGKVLSELLNNIQDSPLLLITAGELPFSTDHSSSLILQLQPFDRAQMYQFCLELLREASPLVSQFSAYVLDLSKGNPQTALEIMMQLISPAGGRKPALTYEDDKWSFDPEQAQKLNLPNAAAELLADKLARLDAFSQSLLKMVSVIGPCFDLSILFGLQPLSELIDQQQEKKEIMHILLKAADLQLLKVSGSKIFFEREDIRLALCKDLSPVETQNIHQGVLAVLEKQINAQTGLVYDQDLLFALAREAMAAKDAYSILRYTCGAALRMQEHHAPRAAAEFLQIYREYARRTGAPKELLTSTGLKLVQVYSQQGNIKMAKKIISELFDGPLTRLEKVQALRYLSAAHRNTSEYSASDDMAIQSLRLTGEYYNRNPLFFVGGILGNLVLLLWPALRPRSLTKKQQELRELKKESIGIHDTLLWNSAVQSRLEYIYNMLQSYNISRRYFPGTSEEAMSYHALGAMWLQLGFYKQADFCFRKMLQICSGLNDLAGIAKAELFIGYNYLWHKADFDGALRHMDLSLRLFEQLGNSEYINLTLASQSFVHYVKSNYALAGKLNENYLHLAQVSGDTYAQASAYLMRMSLLAEQGDLEAAAENSSQALYLALQQDNQQIICNVYTEIAMLYKEKGDLTVAWENITEAMAIYQDKGSVFHQEYTVNVFNYYAEILLARQKAGEEVSLTLIKAACRRALQKTKKWPTHYGGALRAAAQYEALAGRLAEAQKLFELAVKHCRQLGRPYEQGKCLYAYALFCQRRGQTEKYQSLLLDAKDIFKEIGADLYVTRINKALHTSEQEIDWQNRLQERSQLERNLAGLITQAEELDYLLEELFHATRTVRGGIFVWNQAGERELRVWRSFDNTQDFPEKVVDLVFQTGAKVTYDSLPPELSDGSRRSLLCLPIKKGEEVLGVCYLEHPEQNIIGKNSIAQAADYMTVVSLVLSRDRDIEQERRVNIQFAQMIPPEIKEQIYNGHSLEDLPPVKKYRVISTTSIQNFAGLLETLKDRTLLYVWLNNYYRALVKPIYKSEDTGYLAFTNEIKPDRMVNVFDEPDAALQALVEMHKQLPKLPQFIQGVRPFSLKISTGLASGEVISGLVGHPRYVNYLITGIGTELAAQLAQLSRFFGSQVIFDASIYDALNNKSEFNIRFLGSMHFNNEAEPVKIYEENSANNYLERALKQATGPMFSEMQDAFAGKDFKRADALLDEIAEEAKKLNLDINNDPAVPLYKTVISNALANPPAQINWTGALNWSERRLVLGSTIKSPPESGH